MIIILVGSFRYPMYAPAFAGGLEKLGHEVIRVDYEQYHLEGEGLFSSYHNKIQDRYHYGLKMHRYNASLIKTVEERKPNFVFLYRCYHVWPSTLERIKDQTVIMSYNNDDPFSGVPSRHFFRYHLACAKYCDINFVYRNKNIDDYAQIGIHNVRVLLPYYIEKKNFYEDIPDDLPLAFVGHFENDGRDTYIKALKDAGIPVSVYNGSYWERAPLYEDIKDIIKPGVNSIEYNHVLNRCRIALIFLSKLNHDTYTRRCFEIPATKTLILCEHTEDMNKMFPADECAVYFKTKDELVEKAKYLLEHPKEIDRIAKNGYERLRELGGSEVDRCKEIVDIYKSIKR